jgi:hypothetical protein
MYRAFRPLGVGPSVVMFENYVVARGHIRKIHGVQTDARTVGDGKATATTVGVHRHAIRRVTVFRTL